MSSTAVSPALYQGKPWAPERYRIVDCCTVRSRPRTMGSELPVLTSSSLISGRRASHGPLSRGSSRC
jgi:hypothetical protein